MIFIHYEMEIDEMLALQIELKRQEMFHIASQFGFTAKETVKCSQELDLLLNKQLNNRKKFKLNTSAYSYTYNLAK
mgnify:CR=1 FL=1